MFAALVVLAVAGALPNGSSARVVLSNVVLWLLLAAVLLHLIGGPRDRGSE